MKFSLKYSSINHVACKLFCISVWLIIYFLIFKLMVMYLNRWSLWKVKTLFWFYILFKEYNFTIFGATITKAWLAVNFINGKKWQKLIYFIKSNVDIYFFVAFISYNAYKIFVHLMGRYMILFYQMSMLFSFGISHSLCLIILWQTLPSYWKDFEIFIWEWMILGPSVASMILSTINHLVVIFFTILCVSNSVHWIVEPIWHFLCVLNIDISWVSL